MNCVRVELLYSYKYTGDYLIHKFINKYFPNGSTDSILSIIGKIIISVQDEALWFISLNAIYVLIVTKKICRAFEYKTEHQKSN